MKHLKFAEWVNDNEPSFNEAKWLPALGLAAASFLGGSNNVQAQAPPIPSVEEKEEDTLKIMKDLYSGVNKTMIKGDSVYFLGVVPLPNGIPSAARDKDIALSRAELNAYKNLMKELKVDKATGSVAIKKMFLPKTNEAVVLMRANKPVGTPVVPKIIPKVQQSRDPALP